MKTIPFLNFAFVVAAVLAAALGGFSATSLAQGTEEHRTYVVMFGRVLAAHIVCSSLQANEVQMEITGRRLGFQRGDLASGGRYHAFLMEKTVEAMRSHQENPDGFCDTARLLFGPTGMLGPGLLVNRD